MKNSTTEVNSQLRNLSTAIILMSGLFLTGQVSAASQCKGLQNAACAEKASACSWVNGYVRQDGRKVNAFCRSKAKRTSKAASQSDTDKK